MTFPVAVSLSRDASLDEIERAVQHSLDTVIVPVDQNNWRHIVNLMDSVNESGWRIDFFLWAKGGQVKGVPLHRLANHPCLKGWLIQGIDDLILIAMLRATTEAGNVWAWKEKVPFVNGVLSHEPVGGNWWSWILVDDLEQLEAKIINALLSGSEGVCFSLLPSEEDLKSKECLKAIGFFAVQLRLWKPLLSERPKFSEGWEWKTEETEGWIYRLGNEESMCLFRPISTSYTLTLRFPFSVREGVRAYSVRFPAMVRLPLQRKGDSTLVKLDAFQRVNLIWLTGNPERVQKMHRYTNELTPRAMQFAVQWALARRERLLKEDRLNANVNEKMRLMLQEAKRRQFSQSYLTACQILRTLGALS